MLANDRTELVLPVLVHNLRLVRIVLVQLGSAPDGVGSASGLDHHLLLLPLQGPAMLLIIIF